MTPARGKRLFGILFGGLLVIAGVGVMASDDSLTGFLHGGDRRGYRRVGASPLAVTFKLRHYRSDSFLAFIAAAP